MICCTMDGSKDSLSICTNRFEHLMLGSDSFLFKKKQENTSLWTSIDAIDWERECTCIQNSFDYSQGMVSVYYWKCHAAWLWSTAINVFIGVWKQLDNWATALIVASSTIDWFCSCWFALIRQAYRSDNQCPYSISHPCQAHLPHPPPHSSL